LLPDCSVSFAERKKQRAQERRKQYAKMPLEKRLEINAKRRVDYQRKKLERESNKTVNPQSNQVQPHTIIVGNPTNLMFICSNHLIATYICERSDEDTDELGEGWLRRNPTFTSRIHQCHRIPTGVVWNLIMRCVVHIINANDLWIIGDLLIEGVSTHSDKNIQLNAKIRAKYHMARNQNDDISFQITTPGTQYFG
jgi:hypothetical protein